MAHSDPEREFVTLMKYVTCVCCFLKFRVWRYPCRFYCAGDEIGTAARAFRCAMSPDSCFFAAQARLGNSAGSNRAEASLSNINHVFETLFSFVHPIFCALSLICDIFSRNSQPPRRQAPKA